MLVIEEDNFFQILDKYESKQVEPFDDGYYPSIEEINKYINGKNKYINGKSKHINEKNKHINEKGDLSTKIIDFLVYFNQNPYKGNKIYDNDEEYQKTLKYIDTVLKKGIIIV